MYVSAMTKRIPGIEPHPRATADEIEAFKPSLIDMINHARLALAYQDAREGKEEVRSRGEAPSIARYWGWYYRERGYTSAQINAHVFLRKKTFEFWPEGYNARRRRHRARA